MEKPLQYIVCPSSLVIFADTQFLQISVYCASRKNKIKITYTRIYTVGMHLVY